MASKPVLCRKCGLRSNANVHNPATHHYSHPIDLEEPSAPPTAVAIPPAIGRLVPWLHTLGVAVLGAFVVGVLETGLAMLTGVGPTLWSGEGLRHMVQAGIAAAVVIALAYVKQSPLGRYEWSEEQRAAERARLEGMGRLPR